MASSPSQNAQSCLHHRGKSKALPKRLAVAPVLKHLTHDDVTVERSYRLTIDMLPEMLDYTATGVGNYEGHADRLKPLRRYMIAAI